MILQTTDELEEKIGNKYALVIVASKRARQLKEGHLPLVRETSPHPLSVALDEIGEEKIIAIAPPEEEIAPAPRDVIASLIAGTDFDLDEDLDLEDSDAVDDLAALLVGADEEEDEEEEADTEPDLLTSPAVAVAEEEEDEEEEAGDAEDLDSSAGDGDEDEDAEE